MKRRAKLDGFRMPYLAARCFRTPLRARRWKKVFDALSIIEASMRPSRSHEQMLDRPRIVSEHAAFAHAEPAAFEHDDAARFERLRRFLDRLPPAHHPQI